MTAPLLLNVNDHAAGLYMVTRILRTAGYRVIEARTGGEALELAQSAEKPALVVLDIRLPDISGVEVCRHLKSDPRTQDIKVLHTSATYVSTDSKIEGLEAGADGYLTQPFEPQDLIATVRSLIRLHEVEQDLQMRNSALVEQDRRKDEFLAMLAHELRNPLASLQLGMPVLRRFPARDELEHKTLDIMQRQVKLLVQLVDDLLDVSRVTRGRIDLHRQSIDLGALVTTVAEGMRERVVVPRGQKLAIDVPSTPAHVDGDPGRLEQVITNLLDNASKYSDAGTTITITLAVLTGQHFAELSVRDQGIGIDPAMLPRVFDLFAQASTSLARSHGGLGIGLTLVRALVELHGGTIAVESHGRGTGSVFRVRLPLRARGMVSASMPAAAIPTAIGRRVLLVDDNADARELLRALCELDGHVVEDAEDGPSGVERGVAFSPDIAFIDIGLPGFDGYEVARRLRAQGVEAHLVALSGYGSPEHRAQAREAGFDEHLIKPIERDTLLRVIGGALAPRPPMPAADDRARSKPSPPSS